MHGLNRFILFDSPEHLNQLFELQANVRYLQVLQILVASDEQAEVCADVGLCGFDWRQVWVTFVLLFLLLLLARIDRRCERLRGFKQVVV